MTSKHCPSGKFPSDHIPRELKHLLSRRGRPAVHICQARGFKGAYMCFCMTMAGSHQTCIGVFSACGERRLFGQDWTTLRSNRAHWCKNVLHYYPSRLTTSTQTPRCDTVGGKTAGLRSPNPFQMVIFLLSTCGWREFMAECSRIGEVGRMPTGAVTRVNLVAAQNQNYSVPSSFICCLLDLPTVSWEQDIGVPLSRVFWKFRRFLRFAEPWVSPE